MSQLPNYLRSNRKRLALSQEEVSFLLGSLSGAKASRHERFGREPCLATALAYEVIFQKPVRELFAGLYSKIEQQVAKRAKVLTHRVLHGKSEKQLLRKRQTFINLAARQHTKKSS